jgi:hypothetical protein
MFPRILGAETVRGQIKMEGGAPPDGARITVNSRRISSDGNFLTFLRKRKYCRSSSSEIKSGDL